VSCAPCPECLQRDPRYRGQADQVWISGFVCDRCDRWHVERCRAGTSGTCAGCAPAFRFELQDRLCSRTLDLIDAIPLDQVRHFEAVLEILQAAADFRVPLNQRHASLESFSRALAEVMEQLQRLESPIEYEMHLILERAGLRDQFIAQQPIPVEFVRRSGLVVSPTTPDFSHRFRPIVIFCDGGHHGSLEVRETDNGVLEALQARGYLVLRFTGREILSDPAFCVARVRRALERPTSQSAA
jgi:very-short-patch-repair endonuclease